MYWIEAAKRLGIVYVCMPPSLPAQPIADRMHDTMAKAIFVAGAAGLDVAQTASNEYFGVAALLDHVSLEGVREILAGYVAVSSAQIRNILSRDCAPREIDAILEQLR